MSSQPSLPRAWHSVSIAAVVADTGSDPERGLATDEAVRRLARDGANAIRAERQASSFELFLRQFESVVVWVLIGAAAIALALGETADGIAIVAIVLLNAAIGFVQEHRAERAVAALAELTAPRARVLRDGHSAVVPAAGVVRGDLLQLEAGDLVAADARIVASAELRANEAPLTGESEAVDKSAAACAAETPLAERSSMIYLGTSIIAGTGRAVVTDTAMATEVGRIAGLLESASSGRSPLQRNLDRVGSRLLWACLAVVAVVFAIGLQRGVPTYELFLSAVSLAVAAIPEGLPAVVTVALALGVSRMAHRRALVRRLPAIETLGQADVICTDKTGTLTVGEMTARKIVTLEQPYTLTGEGYGPEGSVLAGGESADPRADAVLAEVLLAAASCNDAEIVAQKSGPGVVGDPTEGALLVAAAKGGVWRGTVEAEWPRVFTLPFDGERKRMTIVRRREGRVMAFVKGAPEGILALCTRGLTRAGEVSLGPVERAKLGEATTVLASDGLRVLALAVRSLPDATISGGDVEQDLTFVGLIGIHDPPRSGVRDAIRRCADAGIRVVMITGDHPTTARAIARELGILRDAERVLVGRELDQMSDAALAEGVRDVAVYARVTAEDKLRIVRAWKANGAVVAMTGDGVNDAPALKEASIGIAMGIAGTEVTKQAADLVIADDDFSSIVAAIEEGRGIDDNIRKTLAYLLAGNAGELATMILALLAGWPLPLLPIHLLWINLVSDGLPAVALVTDPVDEAVLSRRPRGLATAVIDRDFLLRIAAIGLLTAATTLAPFFWILSETNDLAAARSAAFMTLVFAELLRSFGARSETRTVGEVGIFTNRHLFLVVALSIALQLALPHVPALRAVFGLDAIGAVEMLVLLLWGSAPFCLLEAWKLVRRSVRSSIAAFGYSS